VRFAVGTFCDPPHSRLLFWCFLPPLFPMFFFIFSLVPVVFAVFRSLRFASLLFSLSRLSSLVSCLSSFVFRLSITKQRPQQTWPRASRQMTKHPNDRRCPNPGPADQGFLEGSSLCHDCVAPWSLLGFCGIYKVELTFCAWPPRSSRIQGHRGGWEEEVYIYIYIYSPLFLTSPWPAPQECKNLADPIGLHTLSPHCQITPLPKQLSK
jgi:hypothetical protein